MRIGIIGAGQLGQMLGFAGRRLGLEFTFLDPSTKPPASIVGDVLQFPFDSRRGLRQLVSKVDVLTYEFENLSVDAIQEFSDILPIYPPLAALHAAQDRLREKKLFEELGIPVVEYAAVTAEPELRKAVSSLGLPLVLKTRRLGYDGKGQTVLHTETDLAGACATLGGRPMIAESWIDFDREVSAIAARNSQGETILYPITENRHNDGILRTSRAPDASATVAQQAERYVTALLQHLNYVGVLALEFFVQGERLFANEFAPRVHNSGHWTIEGAVTSQFENHLRAILNRPLGDPSAVAHAGMINLIGSMPPAPPGNGIHLHDYGKTPRPGRKLGHITVLAGSAEERDRKLAQVAESVAGLPRSPQAAS